MSGVERPAVPITPEGIGSRSMPRALWSAGVAACWITGPPRSTSGSQKPVAGWKANAGNGHCLINRSDRDVVYIEVGSRIVNETVVYSDIDMRLERDKNGVRYLRKTGEPHPPRKA